MQLTPTHKFILFTLGFWYKAANKKLSDRNLSVSISKALFIDIIKKSGIVEKQPRAIYKNLELLEKNKLIKYDNKGLSLTKKGEVVFNKIFDDMKPYMDVIKLVTEKDPLSYSKRLQTRFSI